MQSLSVDVSYHPDSSSPGSVGRRTLSTTSTDTSSTDAAANYEVVDERAFTYPSAGKSRHLGHGSYGTVMAVHFRGRQAALKLFSTESKIKSVHTEARLLVELNHPNVIKLFALYQSVENPDEKGLILELMPGGSLHQLLHVYRQVRYYTDHALGWAHQCITALVFLHERQCLHRDLKPSNMLLSDNFIDLKLCDFGTAAHIKNTMTNNRGSAAYMAPEVFRQNKYNEKCDIYSFGISLWEIMSRQVPTDEGEPYRVLWVATMNDKRPPKIEQLPEPFMELIERCWHKDPNERPSAEEVLRVLEIFMEIHGNRFRRLVNLTTNHEAFASNLRTRAAVTNTSAPADLDHLGVPRKPSAPPAAEGYTGAPTPPPRPHPTYLQHRRGQSGDYTQPGATPPVVPLHPQPQFPQSPFSGTVDPPAYTSYQPQPQPPPPPIGYYDPCRGVPPRPMPTPIPGPIGFHVPPTTPGTPNASMMTGPPTYTPPYYPPLVEMAAGAGQYSHNGYPSTCQVESIPPQDPVAAGGLGWRHTSTEDYGFGNGFPNNAPNDENNGNKKKKSHGHMHGLKKIITSIAKQHG